MTIKKIEKENDSKVITLVHKKGRSPLLDMLFGGFITISDAEQLSEILRNVPEDKTLDILLYTPGGVVLAAEQMTEILHLWSISLPNSPPRVTALIWV